jgi:hypothetical protein
MSQASAPPPASDAPTPATALRVSAYERVASLLVALLVLVGFSVTVIVLLWLARRAMAVNRPVPVDLVAEEGSRDDPALGVAEELEEPGVEELAELDRPQLADTLAAVTTAVSTQAGALDENFGNADVMGSGRGRGGRRGQGDGGDGDRDVIPRWHRFKLPFGGTLAEYARQLDFFEIELGVVTALDDTSVVVDYASKLSTAAPVKRRGAADEDQRLYFTEQDLQLRDYQKQLLAKAGIAANSTIIAMFIPAAVDQELARLELERANGRPIEEIRRTVFGIKPVGDNYSFYVMSQEYRQRPP